MFRVEVQRKDINLYGHRVGLEDLCNLIVVVVQVVQKVLVQNVEVDELDKIEVVQPCKIHLNSVDLPTHVAPLIILAHVFN